MIRLKDIAARAGVSLMTVSKVLRDAPDVSQATKARIRRLAEEMGYVPDAQAQGLRTRRTRLLGVIIPSLAPPFFHQSVLAIQEKANDAGYDLIIVQTQDQPQKEETSLRRLLSRRIDGLFVAPTYRLAPSAAVYDDLRASAVPTVLLGHSAPFCSSFCSVETDDESSSFNLTHHLISLGHRQIAFLAGPPAAPWAQERLQGYRRALRDAEIQWDDRLIFTAGSTREDGHQATLQLLGEATSATAIVANCDPVALGAATALVQHQIRVPEDISLAGFGDTTEAESFRTPITTVRLPLAALGQAAADAMFRSLRGEKPEKRRLPCELVLRASTAPNQAVPRPTLPETFNSPTVPPYPQQTV